MILQGYGLSLIRLQESHIEMVRQWRNSPEINQFMDYREPITPDQQRIWFSGLDPEKDFYFIIRYGTTDTGLIHLSHLNIAAGRATAGIFVWDRIFQGTPLPFHASMVLLEYFFEQYPLHVVMAKVMPHNTAAIHYNQFLGFKMIHPSPYPHAQGMELKKQDFGKTLNQWRPKLLALTADPVRCAEMPDG